MSFDVYMQYSNCIAVKGYGRSAIYDLQLNRYILTSNYFAELLQKGGNKISLIGIENELKEYLEDLVKDGWGTFINNNTADLFPALELCWNSNSLINNAQIDLKANETVLHKFFSVILPQYENLLCRSFHINFVEKISYDELLVFLKGFDDTHVISLSLSTSFVSTTQEEFNALFNLQPRLQSIVFYHTPLNNIEMRTNAFYTNKGLDTRHDGDVVTDYFKSNIQLFSESQEHNTYYNRKLCIDADGNIKNSPEHALDFGNIKTTQLKDVFQLEGFQKFWSIKKDIIDVCKDCEFRHMCVDYCVPIQRNDGSWMRSKECNYNPYINKWAGEEGYRTLAESGITVNADRFQIDIEMLVLTNISIWGYE